MSPLDELAVLKAMMDEYIEVRCLDAELKLFSQPDKLIAACETDSFHLYLLDIVKPMVNGIELGREIRRFDPRKLSMSPQNLSLLCRPMPQAPFCPPYAIRKFMY